MQRHRVPLDEPLDFPGSGSLAAADPIGEVNDSMPICPDLGRPKTRDVWEKMIKKQPLRKPPKRTPDIKRPGTDSRIDDYA